MRLDFHRDIYLPADLIAQVQPLDFSRLIYTRHAAGAAIEDGLRAHELPLSLVLSEWTIVCVETWSGRATGLLVRRALPSRPGWHLVLAVSVPDGKVKTVWLNEARDTHRTLDRKKYVSAP